MIYDLKTIALSFMNLREKVGSRELNLTKNVYVGIIDIPNNPTYYLILNNTKNKLKVLFENKETISFNSKIFISINKPKKVYSLHINENSTAAFSTLNDVVENPKIREEETSLRYMDEDILNKYYSESTYLNINEDYSDYLYRVVLNPELFKKLQIITSHNEVTLIIDVEKQHRLRDTVIDRGILYTNNIVHVLEIISRINEYVPTRLILSLKNQRLRYKDILINIAHEYGNHDYEKMPDKVEFQKLINQLLDLLYLNK